MFIKYNSIVTRFFRTPAQKTNYSNQTACWRSCGNTLANHFHIFWSCPSVGPFWREILRVLEAVFKRKMFLNFKVLYLCDLDGLDYTKQDKYLLRVLLVGCKKALTRKWLKKDKPTIKE